MMTKETMTMATEHMAVETGTVTKTATPEMIADEAMKRIWTDWLAYHNAQFSGRKYYITAADQMAFYEIAQPIMRSLATSTDLREENERKQNIIESTAKLLGDIYDDDGGFDLEDAVRLHIEEANNEHETAKSKIATLSAENSALKDLLREAIEFSPYAARGWLKKTTAALAREEQSHG